MKAQKNFMVLAGFSFLLTFLLLYHLIASSTIMIYMPRSTNISYRHPYTYSESVDFRIIVLTFKRPKSLESLLHSVQEIIMDGKRLSVEIWIDRDRKNVLHEATVNTSTRFALKNDFIKVHYHSSHVGLYGQWLLTYSINHLRPDDDEIVLFLEDDQSVSKFCYRWLRAVHKHFENDPGYLGASLRALDRQFPLKQSVPANHSTFMYRLFSTHGFSPSLKVWSSFQQWFADHINRENFKPYVPGIKPTNWYKTFEKRNSTHTMWSMWLLYYSYVEQLFTVYFNPKYFKQYTDPSIKLMPCFDMDRQEAGLHFSGKGRNNSCHLIDSWNDSYANFPKNILKFDWSGGSI